MNNINIDVNNKIDNFYKSYRELMSSDFKKELKRCKKLVDSDLSDEEEKYVYKVYGFCEDVVDSVKCDCDYWNLNK